MIMASASAEAAPSRSLSFCRSTICARSFFTLAISAGESFTSVRARSTLPSYVLETPQGNALLVYSKRPFAGPKAVLAYLSRYTHRVAIGVDGLSA